MQNGIMNFINFLMEWCNICGLQILDLTKDDIPNIDK